MDADRLITTLARDRDLIAAALSGFAAEDAIWKPSPEAWSVVEIAGHLLDEERLDFRARLKSTLDDPGRPWPAIDPEGWVTAHGYAARSLEEVRDEWVLERDASVAWLRSLGNVDWSCAHEHPALGRLSAGDLLASWVAHDPLHLRQLARRVWERSASLALPHTPDYAGRWS